jgi:hypothetical protein
MALLAAVTELVSAAFGQDAAKPAALSGPAVSEAGSKPAAVVAENPASERKSAPMSARNFNLSPLEMRITAPAPHLRVIATCEADSRQMASLADANELRLLFVMITLG